MRWVSFIHVRRTVNRRAPVPNRNRCSIFALPDPNWWMATSGWLARPYGYSGTMGNVPEGSDLRNVDVADCVRHGIRCPLGANESFSWWALCV